MPAEPVSELAADELGQGLGRDQKAAAGGAPGAAVGRHPATGHQAVDMRVIEQLLGPGMEHGQHADGAADEAAIAGELDDRLGGGLDQCAVPITLVRAQRRTQLLGHGNDHVEIGGWQHLGSAVGEPEPGLLGVAFGTAAVFAGVVGKDLGLAMVAAPQVPTEGWRAAGDDVGDGPVMRGRHRRTVSVAVSAGEPTQRVGQLDHGGKPRSQSGHQLIKKVSELGPDRLGQMGIDQGGGDAAVTEQDLDRAQIDTVFEQPRGVAVAQHVRRHPATDAGGARGGGEGAGQHGVAHRAGAGMVGEQPVPVLMGLPQPAQFKEHRPRHRHQPLLVALADDAQRQVGAVDRIDLQVQRLADAQTAGVGERQAGLVNRVFYAAE